MTLEITQSPAALDDLFEIADHLRDEAGPKIAIRVIEAIQQSYELLAMMPNAGVARPFSGVRFHSLRMLTVSRYPNYLIFYDVTDRELIIRRVLHGARDIEAIFSDETSP